MSVRIHRTGLRGGPLRDHAVSIFETALGAVDPEGLVAGALSTAGDRLRIGGRVLPWPARRTIVVAVGKASVPMARAAERILGARLAGGIALTRRGYGGAAGRIRVIEGGHPLPDEDGAAGARAIAEEVRRAGPDELVLCLLSGGGSALLALPPDAVPLEDLRTITERLLASGATIDEVNAVRRHISTLQGGGLLRLAAPAPVVTLILSDVVGGRLETIASGPTVPDPTTYADARRVLEQRALWDAAPASVRRWIERGIAGEAPETVKRGDLPADASFASILPDHRTAVRAAAEAARGLGYAVVVRDDPVVGEAREAGRMLAEAGRTLPASGRRIALVAGGETTVTVRGAGRGGRNQELGLAAAIELDGATGIVVGAFATDGTDGVTGAAGAIVDGESVERMRASGIDPVRALRENDSYAAVGASGDLLRTGPTGTNVADLAVVLVDSAVRSRSTSSAPAGSAGT